MKAIVFDSRDAAEKALIQCDSIVQGPHELVNPDERRAIKIEHKPYTWIIPHPTGERFALVADKNVEATLAQEAETLTPDWFTPIEKQTYGKD